MTRFSKGTGNTAKIEHQWHEFVSEQIKHHRKSAYRIPANHSVLYSSVHILCLDDSMMTLAKTGTLNESFHMSKAYRWPNLWRSSQMFVQIHGVYNPHAAVFIFAGLQSTDVCFSSTRKRCQAFPALCNLAEVVKGSDSLCFLNRTVQVIYGSSDGFFCWFAMPGWYISVIQRDSIIFHAVICSHYELKNITRLYQRVSKQI